MKPRLKNKVLPALFAALLLGACADPLSAPEDETAAPGGTAQDGGHTVIFPADSTKGLVLIAVNGAPAESRDARLVTPDLSGISYSYRYYAVADDPTEDPKSEDFTPGETALALELTPGRWTITVKAWAGEAPAETEAPALTGSVSVDVAEGSTETLTIALLPDTERSGTFNYAVTFTELNNLGYAFIGVYPFDGGPVVDVIDLLYSRMPDTGTTPLIGSMELSAGFYHIATSVNYKDNDTQQFATKREVLSIYAGAESTYTVSFGAEDFTALLPAQSVLGTGVPETDDGTMYAARTFDTDDYTSIWSGDLNSLVAFTARLPQNTPDTPYFIAITGHTLDGTGSPHWNRLGTSEDPLSDLFAATQGRYVFYDLSGCIGDLGNNSHPTRRGYPDRVTGVILPDTVTTIGMNVFSDATSLMYINLGTQVKSIGTYAFNNCTSLRSITLPDTLTTLGTRPFENSGVLALDLPASVTSISSLAGSRIRSLTLRANRRIIASNMPNLDVVYVPGSQLEGYETNAAWQVRRNAYMNRTGSDGSDFFRVIPGTEVP